MTNQNPNAVTTFAPRDGGEAALGELRKAAAEGKLRLAVVEGAKVTFVADRAPVRPYNEEEYKRDQRAERQRVVADFIADFRRLHSTLLAPEYVLMSLRELGEWADAEG